MKGPFPLHNGIFFIPTEEDKSHADRHVHTDDVQTCNSVRCQRSTLPNSPLALHCINRQHRHVNLAKSSVVGLTVCSQWSWFLHVVAQVEKDWFQTKPSVKAVKASRQLRGLPMASLKGQPGSSYLLHAALEVSGIMSIFVISRTAVPPTVLCAGL